MKKAIITKGKEWKGYNRLAYGLFLLLAAYWLLNGNYEDAVVNLGIGLIFDPFDTTVCWKDRPLFQRAWLLLHLALVLGGFVFLLLL